MSVWRVGRYDVGDEGVGLSWALCIVNALHRLTMVGPGGHSKRLRGRALGLASGCVVEHHL